MKPRNKILIGILIAFVALLVVATFGAGYAIYDKLGNVTGSCDRRQANRPDNFALLLTGRPTSTSRPTSCPPTRR